MKSDADNPEQIEREIERDRNALRATLNELQDELSLDGLSRRVTDQVREHGAQWAYAASDAARANPIALGLTGIGLAWMIFGRGYDPTHKIGSSHDHQGGAHSTGSTSGISQSGRSQPGSAPSVPRHDPPPPPRYRGPVSSAPALPAASAGLAASPSGLGTATPTPSRPTPSWATGSGSRMSGRHDNSTDDEESSMTDRIKDRARHLRDRLSEGTEDLSEEARRRVRDARERALRARESAGRRFGSGSSRVSDGYEAEPLVFGAAAFLLGVGLATLLPRTRREEELLGSYGDQLFDEAEAIYAEEMAKVKRAVSAGLEEAKSAVSDVKNAAAEELSDSGSNGGSNGGSTGGKTGSSASGTRTGTTV